MARNFSRQLVSNLVDTILTLESYDPTDRPWYTRALFNSGKNTISPPYLDSDAGKVITISRAVFEGCTNSSSCGSNHSPDDRINGVAGIDFVYSTFYERQESLMGSCSGGACPRNCNEVWPCPEKGTGVNCTLRCSTFFSVRYWCSRSGFLAARKVIQVALFF